MVELERRLAWKAIVAFSIGVVLLKDPQNHPMYFFEAINVLTNE